MAPSPYIYHVYHSLYKLDHEVRTGRIKNPLFLINLLM